MEQTPGWRSRCGTVRFRGALALVYAAVLVRLPGIGRSLWYDELFTKRRFLDSFLHALARQREANNHPLASVLAWAASRIAGSDAKEVLRAPSIVLGSLAVLAVAWLAGRRARGFAWGAAAAAGLVALFHPTCVGYSQEVRGYAGVLLFSPLIFGLTLALLGGDGKGTRLLPVAIGLGLFFHLTLGILVAGLALYALLARRVEREARIRTLRALGLGLALAFLLYLPILRGLWRFAGKFTGMEQGRSGGFPTLAHLHKVGAMLAMNYEKLLPSYISPWVVGGSFVLLVALGCAASIREKDRLAPATASVLATTAVFWTVGRPLFFARFFIFLLPPLLALLARGAGELARRSRLSPRGAVLVAAPLAVVFALESFQRSLWEVQPVEPVLARARAIDPAGPPCLVGMGSGLVDPSLDSPDFKSDVERDIAAVESACAAIDRGERTKLVVVELFPEPFFREDKVGFTLLREHVIAALERHGLVEDVEKAELERGLTTDVYLHVLRKR